MRHSVKVNFLYQSAYQVLMIITPLITSPYISRVLGAENIGIYSFYYSIAYYFGIFCKLGIDNYGVRSIAQASASNKFERSRVFWEIFVIQAGISTLVVIGYILYLTLSQITHWENALIEIIYVISVATDISWYFFGTEQFDKTTARSFIVRIITLTSIFLFVKEQTDLNLYTIIMAGGSLLSSLILWRSLIREVYFVKIRKEDINRHIRPNLILFIPVISLFIFHYTDKLMLGWLSTMDELGYYSNADKVMNIPIGIITGLGIVMLPKISSLSVHNEWEQIKSYIQKSLVFSMWIGIAIASGVVCVAEDFVPLFFGKGFDRCIILIIVLSPVMLIKSWHHVLRNQYLIPLGKDMQYNMAVITAAILNIAANWLLIPQLGAMGAVIGTLLAELCVALLYTWFARNFVRFRRVLCLTLFYLFCGTGMYIAVHSAIPYLSSLNLFTKLLLEILIGGIVYMTSSSVFMYIIKDELMLIIIGKCFDIKNKIILHLRN